MPSHLPDARVRVAATRVGQSSGRREPRSLPCHAPLIDLVSAHPLDMSTYVSRLRYMSTSVTPCDTHPVTHGTCPRCGSLLTGIRNDAGPAVRPGYDALDTGRYGECPDHGSRLWWHPDGYFYCPADRGHEDEPYVIAEADVYLEHNEAWRVVNGCLWVDEYDATPDTDD